jgi:hypothetical protein
VDQLELNTHSFVVKIWLEDTAEEPGEAKWRGHITHVQSGHRRYLETLDGITAFIAPYLESMGVRLGIYQQVKQWLRSWMAAVTRR